MKLKLALSIVLFVTPVLAAPTPQPAPSQPTPAPVPTPTGMHPIAKGSACALKIRNAAPGETPALPPWTAQPPTCTQVTIVATKTNNAWRTTVTGHYTSTNGITTSASFSFNGLPVVSPNTDLKNWLQSTTAGVAYDGAISIAKDAWTGKATSTPSEGAGIIFLSTSIVTSTETTKTYTGSGMFSIKVLPADKNDPTNKLPLYLQTTFNP